MWIKDAKDAVEPPEIMERLGIKKHRGKSWGPCPACNEQTRGTSDNRGPLSTYTSGLTVCYRCHLRADVVDLVAITIAGAPVRDLEREKRDLVRGWFQDQGLFKDRMDHRPTNKDRPEAPAQGDPHVYVQQGRPPQDEIRDIWKGSHQVLEAKAEASADDPMHEWFDRRNFDPDLVGQTGIFKVLPNGTRYDYPRWWPKKWAWRWRLITPAYETNGNLASLHARAFSDSSPKTRWPLGFEAGGLWMANRWGVRLMRGNCDDIKGVLVCEGFTDLMRASCCNAAEAMRLAILSGTSGSFRTFGQIHVPKDLPVFIATDPDATGNIYAKRVNDQLTDHHVYRIWLGD